MNADCKTIAKNVKYNANVIRDIIVSTPAFPIEQILRTYDADCKAPAENTNCSEKQIRKMQPTVNLDVLNVESAPDAHVKSGQRSSPQSIAASPTRKDLENNLAKVFICGKFICSYQ